MSASFYSHWQSTIKGHGLRNTEYRQGDVLDPDDVRELVSGADVVVHLAFLIFGNHDETAQVNLSGSRSVFDSVS